MFNERLRLVTTIAADLLQVRRVRRADELSLVLVQLQARRQDYATRGPVPPALIEAIDDFSGQLRALRPQIQDATVEPQSSSGMDLSAKSEPAGSFKQTG